jgi:molecular chaperone HscA
VPSSPGQPGSYGSPYPQAGFPGPSRPSGSGVHARKSPGRGLRRAATAGSVVLAILLALGFGGRALWNSIGQAVDNAGGAVGVPGLGGSGGKLDTFGGSPFTLGTVGAATVGRGSVFYAVVKNGHTEVNAVKAPGGGGVTWHSTAPVEPSELHMVVVGGLLVIDAVESASDDNKDTRAVLDAKTGKYLWKAAWELRTDLAYLGESAIVSVDRGGIQTRRVNLRTGKTIWQHTNGAVIQYHPAVPALTWKATAGDVPAPVAGVFQESLGVDATRVVELGGSDNDTATVLNADTGQVRVSGTVSIDDHVTDIRWFAFDGLMMGMAAKGSPSVIAYSLDNLRQKWRYPLNAGATVSHIGACGDHAVCIAASTNNISDVMAVDTRTGKAKWGAPLSSDSGTDPGWYVLGGRMVYGVNTFPDQLGGSDIPLSTVDVGSGQAHELATGSATMRAGSGDYGVVLQVAASGVSVGYTAIVYDLATGKKSGTLDIGAVGRSSAPQPAIAGTTVAVVNNSQLYLANAPGLAS